ncbi:MAG: hypothetical protein LBB85_02735 [Dysgonamonadaceae bacterium]|nr:hypothetical protein [Dysgonamonadaceae bacterium]
MKQIFLITLFAAIAASSLNAQEANPKREVLFTLGANEEIYYTEYFMRMTLNGYKFAAIIENQQTHEFTFVFNGKRIAKAEGIKHEYGEDGDYYYDEPINVFYLDPEKDDGYGYRLNVAGRWFTKLGNKVLPNVITELYAFSIKHNGKYAFGYKESGKYYANIDGKIFGPYQYVYDVAITDNGKYAFSYWENDKYWYNVNGKEVSEQDYDTAIAEIKGESPNYGFNSHMYDYIQNEVISSDGAHIFYSNMEYDYVVIDGNKLGNHPAIHAYYDEKKNAFVWNSIEGKALVVYEYKLD